SRDNRIGCELLSLGQYRWAACRTLPRHLGHTWLMYVECMRPAAQFYGLCMESAWALYGVCMGLCMESVFGRRTVRYVPTTATRRVGAVRQAGWARGESSRTARTILRTARLDRCRAAGQLRPCRSAAAAPPASPGAGV